MHNLYLLINQEKCIDLVAILVVLILVSSYLFESVRVKEIKRKNGGIGQHDLVPLTDWKGIWQSNDRFTKVYIRMFVAVGKGI